jgi:DNA-3-methyladenine glycosylase
MRRRRCWLGSFPRLPSRRLPKSFYARDALTVARELIGCVFTHEHTEGRVSVRLVETEAYRGPIDPGSHGYRGVTPRTEVMYGPPARLYVYFTYGMHWCANVVCAREGECEAVLLRAGEPIEGVEAMRTRRAAVSKDRLLASGPARLAQALGIGPQHNGASLLRGGEFWCSQDDETEALRSRSAQTLRIGLSKGRGDDIPWRFVVPGHPHASRSR